MYLTTPQNHAYAVDVRTGRPLWHYQRTLPKEMSLCCGPQNRGLAALGDRLFMGTLDAHVVEPRREDRPRALGRRRGGRGQGLQLHGRAAGREGQGHRRRGRRRVRRSRLHRRLRRRSREARVALLHDPGDGEPGNDDLEGRLVEARRRADLGHRLVRSRAQPALLGHRQPRTADVRRQPARRQPVLGFAGRARPRHRHAEVAFPVHAARRARLGLHAHADPVRRHDRRHSRASWWRSPTATGSSTCWIA